MDCVTLLPQSRPFTRADLDAMPDDGHRHELIDGALIVTPAPGRWHQTAVGELFVLLRAACPPDLQVMLAPFDVVLAVDTVVEPDLLVARRSDLTDRDLPAAPLLAVEVLSPSTRHLDLSLKRARYEVAGVRSYWVIDPLEPSLRAWNLVQGEYVEQAHVAGDHLFVAGTPVPVEFAPAALVR